MDFMSKMTDLASYAKTTAVQATTLVAGSELEKKLTEATSNEPWGASGTMLSELAKATFSYDDFKTVMTFVWKNLQLSGSLWRVVYKTLNLLDHLIRNGSDRVIEDARDHLRELKGLQKFEFVDPEGKDTGVNVREKAKQIVELLNNDQQLNEEREKARASRNRYTGVSARDMGVNDGPSGGGKDDFSSRKGFSDDDFKFAADRSKSSATGGLSSYLPTSGLGLTSVLSSAASTVSEYAQVRRLSCNARIRTAGAWTSARARDASAFCPIVAIGSCHPPSPSPRHLPSPLSGPPPLTLPPLPPPAALLRPASLLRAGGEQADAIDGDAVPLV